MRKEGKKSHIQNLVRKLIFTENEKGKGPPHLRNSAA